MGVKRKNNSDGTVVKKRAVRFNFIDVLIILAVLLIAAIVVICSCRCPSSADSIRL